MGKQKGLGWVNLWTKSLLAGTASSYLSGERQVLQGVKRMSRDPKICSSEENTLALSLPTPKKTVTTEN